MFRMEMSISDKPNKLDLSYFREGADWILTTWKKYVDGV